MNVVSEEGQRAEMREEDDDLLRAAEELGIDLSGVRVVDDAPAADRRAGSRRRSETVESDSRGVEETRTRI